MANLKFIPRQNVLINLDNLLYAESYQDYEKYKNEVYTKLVFGAGVEVILKWNIGEFNNYLERENKNK